MQPLNAENLVVKQLWTSEFRNFKSGNYNFWHATTLPIIGT